MKILVVRFSSIGDIVLCSPVVRCLYSEGHEVHFLTKKSYLQLVNSNPYISKTFSLEKNWKSLIREIQNEQYDRIIDLHKNLRTLRLKLFTGVKSRSFNKINAHKWMKIRWKKHRLPEVHIVDRYFKTVQDLGVRNDQKGLDYFFPKDFDFDVEAWLNAQNVHQPYIAWVIGGTHATKRFPEKKIVTHIKSSKDYYILIGGPEEKEMGDRIAGAFDRVINAAGHTSIPESCALLQKARLVISNDTGMMHIAAAMKKKIISIWGNTIPEFGMSPYLPSANKNQTIAIEIEDLLCRPCSKIGFSDCPKSHFNCMNLIENKAIQQAKTSLLSNEGDVL